MEVSFRVCLLAFSLFVGVDFWVRITGVSFGKVRSFCSVLVGVPMLKLVIPVFINGMANDIYNFEMHA